MEEGKVNDGVEQIILGVNQDEGTLWSYARFPILLTETHFSNLVQNVVGEKQYAKILEFYHDHNMNNRKVLAEMIGDIIFHCATRKAALGLAKTKIPTYAYYFKYFSSDISLMVRKKKNKANLF